MRLLLVEDDRMIGESLVKGLRDEAFAVDWVRDGAAALAALQDGLSVLQAVRATGSTLPILRVTARDGLTDRRIGPLT
jgi:DNA-binding response OmpR family regulator